MTTRATKAEATAQAMSAIGAIIMCVFALCVLGVIVWAVLS